MFLPRFLFLFHNLYTYFSTSLHSIFFQARASQPLSTSAEAATPSNSSTIPPPPSPASTSPSRLPSNLRFDNVTKIFLKKQEDTAKGMFICQ